MKTNSQSIASLSSILFMLFTIPLVNAEEVCFESREGSSELVSQEISPGEFNLKCSPKTGAVLWWSDPFLQTIPMKKITIPGEIHESEAVVRPRIAQLATYRLCGTLCHNGAYPPLPKNKNPRPLIMHLDIIPDPLNLQHGKQNIWCLDCHNAKQRNMLIDNFGNPISFNEPQKLCGKCHGSSYRDWREGIHGKRIGEWRSDGKKRWFVCTECHNPHDVQQGSRHSGFGQLEPEAPPKFSKGVENADHELKDRNGHWKDGKEPEGAAE